MFGDSGNRPDRSLPVGISSGAKPGRAVGLTLPDFNGPMTAFVATPRGWRQPKVYLGGDLHATHPDATVRTPCPPRDDSLDRATIVIDDLEHESRWATAEEGVWCIDLGEALADSAPYFSLFDSTGRLRHWLILPPARQMLGTGHLWLPFIRPWPSDGRASSAPRTAGARPSQRRGAR
jgi:hypothetical protein